MADVLVSVVSEAFLNQLISIAFKEINGVWGFKDELRKLHRTLVSIKAVLTDAGKKQVKDEAIRLWLRNLNDIAYDIEDIFDEFEYERCKLEIQGRMQNKVRNFFTHSKLPLPFRLKMVSKVKDINRILDEIEKRSKMFNFVSGNSTVDNGFKSMCIKDRPETSSHVVDSEVVGRELDKSRIIDLLINSSNNREIYSVVRIVGIGGVGKTTLAQLVYNDKSVEDHFDIKMWTCVSQYSNQMEIYNKLLESIKGKKSNLSSLDVMVKSFKESLRGKQYLIVLDDVWKDGNINWEELLTDFLSMGVQGSKILVTARSNEDIPSIMAMGSIHTHRLVGLPEEECWSLFERIAFGHGGAKKTPNLIEVGKKIVRKCAGVPLAVKTLRSLMYSKRHENQWLSILNEEIWNLPEGKEKIISVLRLSYDHLPAYLKQCFSYCSVFPKDHSINKKKLIQLWMAEGFLSPSKESKLPENIDNEYFDILLHISFLQVEERNTWGDIKSYKMHDLVHDLALSISVGTECSMMDVSKIQKEEVTRLRRVRLVSENELSTIPEVMYEARKLRTFITSNLIYRRAVVKNVSNDMFLKLSCLRVLDLSHTEIQELPPSIGGLKHLRYFDLSHTKLKALPDSCTNLYHLQTLKLISCYNFKEFPNYMCKLVNLRYLMCNDIWTQLRIRKVGKLNQLQKLSKFFVGKDKGFGIEELKDLNLLGGKLEIHNLEKVKDSMGANLKEKQYISCLELYWKDNDNVVRDDYAVLEGLRPHQKLKKLRIYGFAALKFPTWMTSASADCLQNLISVTLQDCCSCQHLPALGQLPYLKFLKIQRMEALRRIGSEFYCSNEVATTARVVSPSISFPSLKELYLDNMKNLEEWLGDRLSSSSSFPCLEKLDIRHCEKLAIVPTSFASLKTVDFYDSNVMSLTSIMTSNVASLTFIQISYCDELISLPQVLVCGNNVLMCLKISGCIKFESLTANQDQEEEVLPNIYEIFIRNCPVLKSLPDLSGFNSLRMLKITWCKSLKSLPDGIQCLTALEELNIGPFSEELEYFPFPAIGPEGSEQYFVSLRVLIIHGWSGLKSLPRQFQYLTSLQELELKRFHSLDALPEWLGNLASLQILGIHECNNLKYLPSQEQMRRLTALQTLEIGAGCLFLLERCCSDNGVESHKISHIPNCVIISGIVYGSIGKDDSIGK